ncbi:MAG: hypothetical protein K0R65_2153 [Crocinitomicaceae bacterium]|jgi:hypothetical protein|nr:hypothetical protein [Crocinitomicaceae bacterium]
MKKIFFLVLVISFVVAACGKYTTPRKVNRMIVDGSWNITEFIDNGNSIQAKYSEVSMTFTEGGDLITSSEHAVNGSWEVGNARTPAILYINFPSEVDSMHVLADDWVVYKLTREECILKRNMGETFDYDGSKEGLTLRKKQ